MSRKMDAEACPASDCGTRSFKPGSFSDQPRNGTDSSGFFFRNLTLQNLKEVLREIFVFAS